MNGTIAADKKITEEEKKEMLFDNYNLRFLEDASDLMDELGLLLSNMDSILKDDKKLRILAYDYRFLSYLKGDDGNGGELREIKEGRLTVEEFGGLLENNLKNRRQHPELSHLSDEIAELAYKELVQLIAKYRLAVTELAKVLETVSKGLGDTEKLPARIELLVDYAKRKIEDPKLKEKIVKRLELIQRCIDEINSLNYCAHDANDWNVHAHDDILFFTGRVDGFFKGGLFKDREGNEIKGIDAFVDRWLRRHVYGSREVKELEYIARFTHRVQEQVDFIDILIAMLRRDIDPKTNSWVRPEATVEFYNHIDKYAAEFKTEFADNPFAVYLLKNKENIGMQPFRWMAILNGMKQRLGELMGKKNIVIGNAKNYLTGVDGKSGIFEARVKKLREAVAFLIAQINQIFQSETGAAGLVKKVEEATRRIETGVNELWKARKMRFKNAFSKIVDLHNPLLPYFGEIEDLLTIDAEEQELEKHGKGIVQFSEHKDKVIERVRIQDPNALAYLLMLDFDFARLGNLHRDFNDAFDRVKRKDKTLRVYDLSPIKSGMRPLIDAYINFIEWAKARFNLEETENVRNKISKFMREYYG
jgi:hypothetical protein